MANMDKPAVNTAPVAFAPLMPLLALICLVDTRPRTWQCGQTICELPEGREIWVDALLRNGIDDATPKSSAVISHALVLNVMAAEKKRSRCKACGASDLSGTTD